MDVYCPLGYLKPRGRPSMDNTVTLQCQERASPLQYPVLSPLRCSCHPHGTGGSSGLAKPFLTSGPRLLVYHFFTILGMHFMVQNGCLSSSHQANIPPVGSTKEGWARTYISCLSKDTPWKLFMIIPFISHQLELSHTTICRCKEISLYCRGIQFLGKKRRTFIKEPWEFSTVFCLWGTIPRLQGG